MILVDALVQEACARAGSDDFGPDTWREGLEVLVRSLSTEGSLNELGRHVYSDQIVGYLVNRLEVEKWYRLHPEIGDERIVAPLFGLGMPRTGSTALSFLLACDRSRRSLRTWEASSPCPPPETATEDSDPRIAQCQAGIDMSNQMFPDFAGMLPTSATGPQECILIMALDFRSEVFEGMALLPSYTEWLLSCDMAPAYRYHERVLKLLQWHCPPTRWWLKTPAHMTTIDALDEVYPDARFVMTHRDPTDVILSVADLYADIVGGFTDHIDRGYLGQLNVEHWSVGMQRALRFRAGEADNRFYDIDFRAMQADPINEVRGLYAWLGEPVSDEFESRMRDWWVEAAAEREPSTHADPLAFGIDFDKVRPLFAEYVASAQRWTGH